MDFRRRPLAKFRFRGVHAIDSSTIRLAYWCIGWAKHRQKNASVKLHMVANVRSRLPHFCLIDKAKDHDSKKADELLASLKEGDIAILRAYGIAPGEKQGDILQNMPYLQGFEKYFAAAVG